MGADWEGPTFGREGPPEEPSGSSGDGQSGRDVLGSVGPDYFTLCPEVRCLKSLLRPKSDCT